MPKQTTARDRSSGARQILGREFDPAVSDPFAAFSGAVPGIPQQFDYENTSGKDLLRTFWPVVMAGVGMGNANFGGDMGWMDWMDFGQNMSGLIPSDNEGGGGGGGLGDIGSLLTSSQQPAQQEPTEQQHLAVLLKEALRLEEEKRQRELLAKMQQQQSEVRYFA